MTAVISAAGKAVLRVRQVPYEPTHIGEPIELFKEIVKRMADIGWMVGGGTLLGLVRDGRFIATDTDLDFLVLTEGSEPELIKERFVDFPRIVEVDRDGEVQQLAYYPEGKIVDFHFYRRCGETYRCYHQSGILRIGPAISSVLTPYGRVNVPAARFEFLRRKYGDDWTVPRYQQKGSYLPFG